MNSGHFSNTFPKVVNATKRLKFFWVLVFNWWIITTLANKCVVIKALQRNTSPILIISLLKMNKGVKVYIYVSVRWVQAHKRSLYTLGTLGTYLQRWKDAHYTYKVLLHCDSLVLYQQENMLRWIFPPIILALALYPFLPKQVTSISVFHPLHLSA